MHSRDIVVSPDLVIRIHSYATRQGARRAALSEAAAVVLGSAFGLTMLTLVMLAIAR